MDGNFMPRARLSSENTAFCSASCVVTELQVLLDYALAEDHSQLAGSSLLPLCRPNAWKTRTSQPPRGRCWDRTSQRPARPLAETSARPENALGKPAASRKKTGSPSGPRQNSGEPCCKHQKISISTYSQRIRRGRRKEFSVTQSIRKTVQNMVSILRQLVF